MPVPATGLRFCNGFMNTSARCLSPPLDSEWVGCSADQVGMATPGAFHLALSSFKMFEVGTLKLLRPEGHSDDDK